MYYYEFIYSCTGALCEVNKDDCIPNVCLHGGSCRDGINSFSCICTAEYSGRYCESPVLPSTEAVTTTTPEQRVTVECDVNLCSQWWVNQKPIDHIHMIIGHTDKHHGLIVTLLCSLLHLAKPSPEYSPLRTKDLTLNCDLDLQSQPSQVKVNPHTNNQGHRFTRKSGDRWRVSPSVKALVWLFYEKITIYLYLSGILMATYRG